MYNENIEGYSSCRSVTSYSKDFINAGLIGTFFTLIHGIIFCSPVSKYYLLFCMSVTLSDTLS
jgi:uncharacterized membrane protein YesL